MNRYLGTDSTEAIAQVRAREPEWFALAEDVGSHVGDLMCSLQVPHGNERLLLAALLYRRIAGAFEAVVVLAERGMHTEGLTTRRAMLEAMFVLGPLTISLPLLRRTSKTTSIVGETSLRRSRS